MHRGGDRRDPSVGVDAGDLGARPVRAAVARELHEAVVGGNPQQAVGQRRGCDREDRVERLGAGDVEPHAAGERLPFAQVAGEIAADRTPVRTAIGGDERDVPRRVEHVRMLRRERQRRLPVEAVLQFARRNDVLIAQIHRDIHGARVRAVETHGLALIVAAARRREHRRRIVRIGDDPRAVAAGDARPVVRADPAIVAGARRRTPRAVVLHSAADAIG